MFSMRSYTIDATVHRRRCKRSRDKTPPNNCDEWPNGKCANATGSHGTSNDSSFVCNRRVSAQFNSCYYYNGARYVVQFDQRGPAVTQSFRANANKILLAGCLLNALLGGMTLMGIPCGRTQSPIISKRCHRLHI